MNPLESAVQEFIQLFRETNLTQQEYLRKAREIMRRYRLDPTSSGYDFAHLLALQIENLTGQLSKGKKRILTSIIEQLR